MHAVQCSAQGEHDTSHKNCSSEIRVLSDASVEKSAASRSEIDASLPNAFARELMCLCVNLQLPEVRQRARGVVRMHKIMGFICKIDILNLQVALLSSKARGDSAAACGEIASLKTLL